MRQKAINILAILCFSTGSFAQMTTCSTCYTPEELVQNVLVTGCISVSNVVFTGNPLGLGYFNANSISFPFAEGVIMASGDIANAIGPNNSTGITTDLQQPGDTMLDSLIPGYQTLDATILEFDFVPSNALMKFRYIFGSDEYLEYVGTAFNDVFAFYLSGPNPAGGNYVNQNVAIIPNTSPPVAVSINNVNDTSYPAYYVDNGDGTAPNNELLQYDGYTVALTAKANVIACETYHIKLAIADAGDHILDSGVLLEAGSFGDPEIPEMNNYSYVSNDNEIIEGCTDYYVLKRPGNSDMSDPFTINLNIGGTATNGTDITQFPITVTIPAGQTTDTVFYSAMMDNIPEGNEYLIFSLNGACPCNYSPINDTIWVIDNYTLVAGIVENDTTYCSPDQVFLNLHTYIPPLTTPYFVSYTWSSGSHNNSIYVSPASGATTTYYVTITDLCGQVAYDNVTFTISDMSGLNYSSVDNVCYGAAHGIINVTPIGGFDPYTYIWSPVDAGSTTSGYSNTLEAGTYVVTVTDSLGCFFFVTLPISQPDSLFFSYNTTDVTCYNGTDGSAIIEAFGGTPPYSFHWSTGALTNSLSQIHGGYYLVTITDNNQCTTSTSVFVYEPDSLITHTSPDMYICLGQDAAIFASATGGTPAYYFTWSTGQSGPSISVSPPSTNTYFVSCTDINECIAAVDSVTVHIYPAINAQLNTLRDSICKGESATLFANISGGTGGPYNCYLLDGANTIIAAPPFTVSPVHTTTYQIIVEDFCGSPQGIASLTIYVFNPPEVQFTSDITEGCKPLPVNFEALTGLPGMTYNWDFGDGSNSLLSTSPTPLHVFMNEGKFNITLTMTSLVGCVNSRTINEMITVHPNPDARFIPDYTIASIMKPVIFFQNYSIGATVNYWNFGDNTPVSNSISPQHTFQAVGTYIIQLITENQFGCMDTAYSQITIRDEYTLYSPNAFNPNSTIPENRTFMPIGYGVDPDNYHFIIYDRWGSKVYETFDLDHPWNGVINGKKVVAGSVYPWIVIYKDLNGTDHRVTGTVTIVN